MYGWPINHILYSLMILASNDYENEIKAESSDDRTVAHFEGTVGGKHG